ncbi:MULTISPECIES: DUF5953 family protein [Myxococcus]|uniref:Immunity protein 52 domain-containing protein n=1 Tax=Myxococcus llanfairpwllgwyngyllgogerychwyrndrobwllllantysiliogogogochensis TaxID=2590453 RepID=A0A540X9E7_9BACT|nr:MULTISPECIES: DUF5953 family protein [Myxococcus]NTX03277.1 hypothetical protein [Myxococcus sp. CA040A]TQF17852.1 hypothetical protein FJV41_01215 [Myxococcus llanfairpwllgwyngyllgogerychwyrndrobwllllantysiliogogogochensis]
MTAKQRNDLGIIVYGPALMRGDDRPLAVVRAMERTSPGLRLEWTISDEGNPVSLPERDAWIAQGRSDSPGFPLVCNGGGESDLVTLYGLELPKDFGPAGHPLFEVHAALPLNGASIAEAAEMLAAVAEAARAFWGHVTPFRAGVEIARQTKNWAANPQPPPRGLPALKLPKDLRSPEIPHRLGWLSYWSAAAAQAIGFPDPMRDAALLSRARRTTTGGWVVGLTDAPLDLDDPAHLNALLSAYERFPEIGGRSGR